MASGKKGKHHITPESYLAWFTRSGSDADLLYVHDLETGKQPWQSTPNGVGYRRGFYSVDVPDTSPDAVERWLGQEVDGPAARALRRIHESRRLPGRSEADWLALVKFITFMLDRGAAYKDFVRQASRTTNNNAYLQYLMAQVIGDIPGVNRRSWCLWTAAPGCEFVASDQPATCFEADPRLRNRKWNLLSPGTIITMPLGRTLAVEGRFERLPPARTAGRLQVAKLNGATILSADRQVYSSRSEFEWSYFDSSTLIFNREFLLDEWRTKRRGNNGLAGKT
jgi:Protein of unknown function (DUF4238)